MEVLLGVVESVSSCIVPPVGEGGFRCRRNMVLANTEWKWYHSNYLTYPSTALGSGKRHGGSRVEVYRLFERAYQARLAKALSYSISTVRTGRPPVRAPECERNFSAPSNYIYRLVLRTCPSASWVIVGRNTGFFSFARIEARYRRQSSH
jgi:hypothetical protein